jgi:transcriptional regulator with XRE-family HTH domain
MSIVDYSATTGALESVTVAVCNGGYHRLATVRRLQGVSRRTLARRMNVELAEVRRQEDQSSDLPLSVLYQWQKALDVPVAELLVESSDEISRPLMQRAQLVRLMKTALALLAEADVKSSRMAAKSLVRQLVEVMPELENVTAWNAVGKRRRRDDVGVAAFRSLSDDVFTESIE